MFDEDTRLRKCAAGFRSKLEQFNETVRNEINDYLNYAVENCLACSYFVFNKISPKKILTKFPF